MWVENLFTFSLIWSIGDNIDGPSAPSSTPSACPARQAAARVREGRRRSASGPVERLARGGPSSSTPTSTPRRSGRHDCQGGHRQPERRVLAIIGRRRHGALHGLLARCSRQARPLRGLHRHRQDRYVQKLLLPRTSGRRSSSTTRRRRRRTSRRTSSTGSSTSGARASSARRWASAASSSPTTSTCPRSRRTAPSRRSSSCGSSWTTRAGTTARRTPSAAGRHLLCGAMGPPGGGRNPISPRTCGTSTSSLHALRRP